MKPEYKDRYEQFGLNIVYYRKKKKLTQLQLAELMDVDRSHISSMLTFSTDVYFSVAKPGSLCYNDREFVPF